MRVIAGEFKSRILKAPMGMNTRPTSDRLRETLFNVLSPRIGGARFLDLFAGTGAVGIEAISRGAAEVVFVESAAGAQKTLRANLESLGLLGRDFRKQLEEGGAKIRIESADVVPLLRKMAAQIEKLESGAAEKKFDLIFLDPPYDAADEYEETLKLLPALMTEGALVIAEHRRKAKLDVKYGPLARTRLLEQGDAGLSFYALSVDA